MSAQTLPACGQGQANGLADGDIDHFDLVCFTSIPDPYLAAARSLDFLFVDRSVGGNIDYGLNCLASGVPYDPLRNAPCQSGIEQPDWVTDPVKYNRSNWHFAHYRDGGWYDNVSNYVLNQNLIDVDRNPYTPNYQSMDVMNFQFSYLSVMDGQNIANTAPGSGGFFVPYPGDTTRVKDIHDITAFENTLPNATHVYSTTSLATTIGTQTSENFNNLMRDYTQEHNIPLIDFADIGSHTPQGSLCTYNGFAAFCPEYTNEPNGGHLAYGISKQRAAKAMWLMMASVAGWFPGTTTSPTSTPVLTGTPTSTPTRVPTLTATPTNAPRPGDTNNDGRVDGIDYVVWLNHYNQPALPNNHAVGNFNSDNIVDGLDYVIWLNNYTG